MFTGLIQSTGAIVRLARSGAEARLTIRPAAAFLAGRDFTRGESIAVNGACLTVESFDSAVFTSYASQETLDRTNLGGLRQGDRVNLERALSMGDSIGGHLVSGHVDSLCEVVSVSKAGSSVIYRFSFPSEFARQVIPKGSIAVDGVSLTVNACGQDFFEVNVIPATQSETTIGDWRPGRKINLETDLIGKYVERMVGYYTGASTDTPETTASDPKTTTSGLGLDFFRSRGF